MSAVRMLVAILLAGQAAWALLQGAMLFTPACADHVQRISDQFNSALLLAALLAAGGFWSRPHG